MNLRKLSDFEHLQAEEAMRNDTTFEPQIGIFWYSPERDELFGVQSIAESDLKEMGRSTFTKRHDQVWKKEHARALAKNDVNSPFFKGSNGYHIPRGRIFLKEDGYSVALGKWINDYPQAKDLILEEFNLPENKTEFTYDEHWDIGHGWSGDHM